jgi:hypothetical protein
VIEFYLGSCVGVYITAALYNRNSFKNADLASIVRGILGTLVWPIILSYLYATRGDK